MCGVTCRGILRHQSVNSVNSSNLHLLSEGSVPLPIRSSIDFLQRTTNIKTCKKVMSSSAHVELYLAFLCQTRVI